MAPARAPATIPASPRFQTPARAAGGYETGAEFAPFPPAGASRVTDKAAVFAVGRPVGAAAAAAGNPFGGTVAVTLPRQGGESVGLDVFAADGSRVARVFDAASGKAIYLVGRAAHASLEGERLLRQIAWVAAADDNAGGAALGTLRDFLGAFVVLIDDRRARCVSFVTDAMGLLPWFVGNSGGRLVAGTNVLDICAAGLSSRRVDYDAVASWLCYNFVCTDGSLVRDYRRVERGAVSTFHPSGGLIGRREYAPARYAAEVVSPDELVERQHAHVSRAFEWL